MRALTISIFTFATLPIRGLQCAFITDNKQEKLSKSISYIWADCCHSFKPPWVFQKKRKSESECYLHFLPPHAAGSANGKGHAFVQGKDNKMCKSVWGTSAPMLLWMKFEIAGEGSAYHSHLRLLSHFWSNKGSCNVLQHVMVFSFKMALNSMRINNGQCFWPTMVSNWRHFELPCCDRIQQGEAIPAILPWLSLSSRGLIFQWPTSGMWCCKCSLVSFPGDKSEEHPWWETAGHWGRLSCQVNMATSIGSESEAQRKTEDPNTLSFSQMGLVYLFWRLFHTHG